MYLYVYGDGTGNWFKKFYSQALGGVRDVYRGVFQTPSPHQLSTTFNQSRRKQPQQVRRVHSLIKSESK